MSWLADLPTYQKIILGAYAAIVALWPIRYLVVWLIHRRLDWLTLRSPRYQGAQPPLVTAIIPAKDEEKSLPECLASVVAQTYPQLEILVADDRSTDRTPDIAREFASRDSRVQLLQIDHLPPGWTGKTHALHCAAKQARGEWLWFLDADTRHTPDSLSIVMEYARQHDTALASLLPEMQCDTFWERITVPLSGIVLMRSFPLFRVNDDSNPLAFANGQYILVERSAYDTIGGHASVRDRFVEDIYLAREVKQSGRRIRVAMAPEISSTRMYTSLAQLTRGFSRILYDALERRPLPILGKILEPLVFSQTGDVALLVAIGLLLFGIAVPFAKALLVLSLVHQVLKQGLLCIMYGMTSPRTAWYGLFYPLAGIVSDVILVRCLRMCLTGQVAWRGTSYAGATATASTIETPPSPPREVSPVASESSSKTGGS